MNPPSPILTRRRLLATSGAALAAGAPLALVACGADEAADERSPERDAELLPGVIAQQLAVAEAAGEAARAAPQGARDAALLAQDLRRRSARQLSAAVSELGGSPPDQPAEPAGRAESAVEGLGDQLEAAIAAALEVIGELTPERRETIHLAIVEDAAVLAVVRGTLGEEPAPDAFVFGPPVAEVRQ